MGTTEQEGEDFDSIRDRVVQQVEQARGEQDEGQLSEVLGGISNSAAIDLDRHLAAGDSPEALVAAVEAWASVHSYAISRFYFEGPQSLLRRGGFDKRVTRQLQRAAETFEPRLTAVVSALGPSGFSISVGFPWGISIALEWSF
jgi:predicted component of type VI protein secretion system